MKFTPWFWRGKFSYFVDVFLLFCSYLWKREWPFIWRNLNSFLPKMLCAQFGWHSTNGIWNEDENMKNLQTDRWTTWAFSSGELKTTEQKRCHKLKHLHFYITFIVIQKYITVKIHAWKCKHGSNCFKSWDNNRIPKLFHVSSKVT